MFGKRLQNWFFFNFIKSFVVGNYIKLGGLSKANCRDYLPNAWAAWAGVDNRVGIKNIIKNSLSGWTNTPARSSSTWKIFDSDLIIIKDIMALWTSLLLKAYLYKNSTFYIHFVVKWLSCFIRRCNRLSFISTFNKSNKNILVPYFGKFFIESHKHE